MKIVPGNPRSPGAPTGPGTPKTILIILIFSMQKKTFFYLESLDLEVLVHLCLLQKTIDQNIFDAIDKKNLPGRPGKPGAPSVRKDST
jgi:hypothetical protein